MRQDEKDDVGLNMMVAGGVRGRNRQAGLSTTAMGRLASISLGDRRMGTGAANPVDALRVGTTVPSERHVQGWTGWREDERPARFREARRTW